MSKFDGILSAKVSKDSVGKKGLVQKAAKTSKTTNSKSIGKRSHPDFTQITAYVRKETHEAVMRKIYKSQEFSELVEELLNDWLKNIK